jgi:hypothetical protein
MTVFSAQVFQNEYVPANGTDVDAVVTVEAAAGGAVAPTQDRVEVIVIDCSGSMKEEGGAKMESARRATMAAIDILSDGTWFAVVAGTSTAWPLYPSSVGLVRADASTRAEAKQMVARVRPKGGTAMGTWLRASNQLFAQMPGAIAHCILLTDGKNQHEKDWELDAAIAECVGRFQCDARGLGADWNVAELRKIGTALLGSVDIIPSPQEMEAEFTKLTTQAMSKAVAKVALRLWTPQGATVQFVRQVAPSIEELTTRGTKVDNLMVDYPLGAWADGESRDYHIRVQIPPGEVGDERLAARVMLVVDDEQVSASLVRAVWTDDTALSTRINSEVAHYTGQAELADAIATGLTARAAGDEQTATVKLGRAVQLAHEAGNGDTVRLLQKVVEVDDPKTGTVRLKRDVAEVDAMALDVRSTRTVRVNKQP